MTSESPKKKPKDVLGQRIGMFCNDQVTTGLESNRESIPLAKGKTAQEHIKLFTGFTVTYPVTNLNILAGILIIFSTD